MQDKQKKGWIGLEGMEFYAYHGVFEEEQQIGGKYIVDISIFTDMYGAMNNDDLNGTLNYEMIYKLVNQNMEKPVKLIEYLANNIIRDLRVVIAADDKIKLKIRKLHPPLGAKVAASLIEIEDEL
jgi:dihydroneopterin aldolase